MRRTSDGNVWNLGEYPEEFEEGRFVGAPSTWIAGVAGAEAGLHMVKRPRVGQTWLQGISLDIDFLDCARVFTIRHQLCLPIGCYSPYLRTHERSPLDPEGGIQTKFHARGVGIVQVGALDDPEGETLVLTNAHPTQPRGAGDRTRGGPEARCARLFGQRGVWPQIRARRSTAGGGVGTGAGTESACGHSNPPAGADPGPGRLVRPGVRGTDPRGALQFTRR